MLDSDSKVRDDKSASWVIPTMHRGLILLLKSGGIFTSFATLVAVLCLSWSGGGRCIS